MEKTFYLHVAYQTCDSGSRIIVGDTFLAIKEGVTIAEIRKQIWQMCKDQNKGVELQSPTIISITELSKELYQSLTSCFKKTD